MWVAKLWRSLWGCTWALSACLLPQPSSRSCTERADNRCRRLETNSASGSSPASRGRTLSHFCSHSTAIRPMGSTRSRDPLPVTLSWRSSSFTSARFSPTSSARRRPEEYISSMMARSRTASGSCSSVMLSSWYISSTSRFLGRGRPSLGVAMPRAGLALIRPWRTCQSQKLRKAESLVARERGASPPLCIRVTRLRTWLASSRAQSSSPSLVSSAVMASRWA